MGFTVPPSRRSFAPRAVIFLGFLLILAEAPVASASSHDPSPPAAGWQEPVLLSSVQPDGADQLSVGVDGAGSGWALYSKFDGVWIQIWAARMDSNQGWLMPVWLAGNATATVADPRLAVGPGGHGVALWRESAAQGWRLSSRFASPSGLWSDPQTLPAINAGDIETATVGMDAAGNATVVFLQSNTSAPDIWGARGNASSGWGAPQKLEDLPEPMGAPLVAVGRGGDAFAVWTGGVPPSLYAARYTTASGWADSTLLATSTADHLTPAVVVNGVGAAAVAWASYKARPAPIQFRSFDASAGWAPVETIETDVNLSDEPRLSLSEAGDVTAVWLKASLPGKLFSNRYAPGVGWGTPTSFGNDAAIKVSSLAFGADAGGNASVLWAQGDGSQVRIYSSASTGGENWTPPLPLSGGSPGNACCVSMAASATGKKLSAWLQSDGARDRAWTSLFLPGRGWGAPALVDVDSAGTATQPSIAMNNRGAALATWAQHEAVYLREYSEGTGWREPVVLARAAPGHAIYQAPLVVLLGDGGGAVVLWADWGGAANDLWAVRRGSSSGWGAPQQLTSGVNAILLRVAGDDKSTAVALWFDYTGYKPMATVSYKGGLWSASADVSTPSNSRSVPFNSEIRFAANGDAWIVMGSAAGVELAHYAAGVGWDTTENVADMDTVPEPRISVDDGGNLTVVWPDWDSGGTEIWAQRRDVATGWGPRALVHSGAPYSITRLALGGDGAGNLTLLWAEARWSLTYYAANWSVSSRTYAPGRGWGAETILLANASGRREYPQLCVDRANRALATWMFLDRGAYQIESIERGLSGAWTAPLVIPRLVENLYLSSTLVCDTWGNGFLSSQVLADARIAGWSHRYTSVDLWPPELSVDSPLNLSVVASPTVEIHGRTEPGATVEVNGLLLAVSSTGAFSGLVGLVGGANELNVTAVDVWGNHATVSLVVVFDDPTAEALSLLNSVMGSLATTQARVDELSASSAALAAQVADLSAQSAENASRIDELRAQLDAAYAELEGVEANLTAAFDSLGRAWSALNDSLARLNGSDASAAELSSALKATMSAVASAQSILAIHAAALNSTRASLDSVNASLAALQTRLDSVDNSLDTSSQQQGETKAATGNLEAEVAGLKAALLAVAVLAAVGLGFALWSVRQTRTSDWRDRPQEPTFGRRQG